MWGLAHHGNPEDFAWDVATGVSAGSINSMYMSAWAPEDVIKMTEGISDQWHSITSNEALYRKWPGGLKQGIVGKAGLVDDSPALDFLNNAMAPFSEFKRRFTMAAADVATGEYVTFTQDNILFEQVGQAALSSGSIPGVFPPQHFQGRVLMDGGTIWDINIDSAIQQCLEVVKDPSQIVVDVAICGEDVLESEESTGHSVNNYMRKRSWKSFYHGMNSIQAEMRAYPTVNYRYLFQQKRGAANPIDFTNSTTFPLWEDGVADAIAALHNSTSASFQDLDKWIEDNAPGNNYQSEFKQ